MPNSNYPLVTCSACHLRIFTTICNRTSSGSSSSSTCNLRMFTTTHRIGPSSSSRDKPCQLLGIQTQLHLILLQLHSILLRLSSLQHLTQPLLLQHQLLAPGYLRNASNQHMGTTRQGQVLRKGGKVGVPPVLLQ
jgi:hypothetical protein